MHARINLGCDQDFLESCTPGGGGYACPCSPGDRQSMPLAPHGNIERKHHQTIEGNHHLVHPGLVRSSPPADVVTQGGNQDYRTVQILITVQELLLIAIINCTEHPCSSNLPFPTERDPNPSFW
jgi:hypothetical protein